MELEFQSMLVQPQNLWSLTALWASALFEALGSEPGPGGMDGIKTQAILHHPGASYTRAWRLELLFGLQWMSQETGVIRAGVCVREQWEAKTGRWAGSEMKASCLKGSFADERFVL